MAPSNPNGHPKLNPSRKSPYEVLGISAQASQDEIKNAYRNLAKKYHPDLNPGNKDAEKHFKQINSAYELIGTPEQRVKYDRGELSEGPAFQQGQPGGPGGRYWQYEGSQGRRRSGPFYHETQRDGGRYSGIFEGATGGVDEDLFNSIFGRMGGAGGSEENLNIRGQDELYQLEIDFRDAVLGAQRELSLAHGKRLQVKIPPGVDTGTKLRFTGQGGPGIGQAPAGDAYVELKVRPSPIFRRHGKDLELDLPISLSEAILGGEVKVPTIDGSVLLKIPPGVNTGSKMRIAGKGVPTPGTDKRGDEFVILKVVLPAHVDPEFKRAVEVWKERQPYHPREGWPER